MKCARHPDVETNLRCSKCGKPVCPKCLVQAPVGVRCPDCAKLYRLPTFDVSIQHYFRAAGTGLGMAIICGLIWGLVTRFVPGFGPFFYLNFLLAPGAGYAIGEIISLSVNRKRGIGLAVIGGAAVVISYIISIWLAGFLLGVPFIQVFLSGLGLISLFGLLALALGVFVAITRLR